MHTSDVEAFAYPVQRRGEIAYFVWMSGVEPNTDLFWMEAFQEVVRFRRLDDLRAFTTQRKIPLQDELVEPLLMDVVEAWLNDPCREGLDPSLLLNAWNFSDDLAHTLSGSEGDSFRKSPEVLDCYNRLFWANNLPSMTPEGEGFEPDWADSELALLVTTLGQGLERLDRVIEGHPAR